MTSSLTTRILEAAIALFAERGFDGVSLTDLETKAKVTRTSIYQQFGSKEKLFEDALTLARRYPDTFKKYYGEPTPAAFRKALRLGRDVYIAEACWHWADCCGKPAGDRSVRNGCHATVRLYQPFVARPQDRGPGL